LVRRNGFVKARVDSNVLRKGETELREAIRAIAPGWYDDIKIVLNRNVTCKPHTDSANRGHSFILFLGDFTGGALVFEDGVRIEEPRRWYCINGHVRHWNEPHQGTKYSVVLYRPTVSSKSSIIHARRGGKKRTIVISLDTELGRSRRGNIGLDGWTLSPGVLPEEVPEFVRQHWFPGRMSAERNVRLMGAFSAHLRVWESLAAEGSPEAIVLEDDALLVRPIPRELPRALTLLGGVFCGFGRWSDSDEFVRSGEFVAELAKLRRGVNELPTREGVRMRWIMCCAYYLPQGMAAELVAAVRATAKRTLRTPDVWLNRFATHCVFPPPFGDQAAESQCLTGPEYHGSDLYCNKRMFAAARRLGLADRLMALA
jgi:hypothetical protein